MTKITIQIEDNKAQALREKAKRYGLDPEKFLAASVENLISQPDSDFEEAALRVLSKNKELYQRLS
ncbi:MAG: DNA-binding protein [Candidatus Aegiribacteria sp.]|nr:DNA-binding protein [Candidatus Aegiribacteria sp.]